MRGDENNVELDYVVIPEKNRRSRSSYLASFSSLLITSKNNPAY